MAAIHKLETATFGGGCFWCTQAIFKRLKGVVTVTAGYLGGEVDNPSYARVTTGLTGHAESVQVVFDPTVMPYERLLEVFWHTHNPTTKNQQGADTGTQYRSVIFYHSNEQKRLAQASKKKLEEEKVYKDPIVTAIVPFTKFYTAEDHHQNFYERYAGSNMYCNLVIGPKIKKLLNKFGNYVKDEYKI